MTLSNCTALVLVIVRPGHPKGHSVKLFAKLAAGIAGSLLVTGSASAADIAPIIPPVIAPVVIPVPVASPFAGLYVGNAFGITRLGDEGSLFSDALVVGFNLVNGRRIIGLEGKVGVRLRFEDGVIPFVAASARAGFQIGDRAQVYGVAGAGYIFRFGQAFASAGIGGEVLLGENLGIFAEARAIQFFGGPPLTTQFNFGFNWHL